MEFRKSPKTSKWAYVATLTSTGLSGFFFFSANPLLYSKDLLHERERPSFALNLEPFRFLPSSDAELMSNKAAVPQFLKRRFVEKEQRPLNIGADRRLEGWHPLPEGFLLRDTQAPKIEFFSWTPQREWVFEDERLKSAFFTPLILDHLILVSHSEGTLSALSKLGDLFWHVNFGAPLAIAPVLVKEGVFAVRQNAKTLEWLVLDPLTGQLVDRGELAEDIKPDGLVVGESGHLLFQGQEKIWSWSLKTKKLTARFEFETRPTGLHWIDDRFSLKQPLRWVVPLEDGRVYGFDQELNQIWETDLGRPIRGGGHLIPKFDRAALVTDNHYLHVIQLSDGRRLWRFQLENTELNTLGWAAKLDPQLIQQIELPARFEGWALWQTCVDQRLCLFNPEFGQVIGRIVLSEKPLFQPFIDASSNLWFLLKSEGGWFLSHQEGR